MLRGSCPEALSGFVKFHPQYPVLKVPGGASRPPCASRSRLARGCILRASPPRVKGKFGFGRIYCGARADSVEPSGFSQLTQSLPRGPCRPSLWRSLHNLPSAAQSFRDSRDKGFAFHGASSAAWAKAPAIPLDWPISVVASAIDQGRPGGRWPACRPSHKSGAAGRVGRARGGAGRGRRTPADRWAPSSGPRWRARWRRRRAGRPRGRGASGRRAPPAGRRCRGSRTRRRIRIRPDSVDGFYAAFGRLSSLGRLGPFELGGAEAAKRRMRPRPAADCLDAPERVRRGLLARGAGGRERTGLAMPMRGGGALSARALKRGRRVRANEKGAPARADAPE